LSAPLQGAWIVHKSTNLTTAMFGVGLAQRTYLGAFVNATRMVAYAKALGADSIELVPAGHYTKLRPALEDTVCAELYQLGLTDSLPPESPRLAEIGAKVADLKARKHETPTHYWQDVAFALQRDALPYLAEVRALEPGLVEIVGV
jgi:phosphosulfolactate phosphohydrolase-like enzyme